MTIELKGRLDRESLDRIFSILVKGGVACSLLVSDGVCEKIFYFAIGGIRMVSLGGRKGVPIGEILVRRGLLNSEDRDRGLQHAKLHHRRMGEALIELGLVRQEDVDAALRAQLEGEICDLFFWSEAEYEFREGQPPPEFYDDRYRALAVSGDVPDFVREVRSRRELWTTIRKHIPSDRDVFEITEAGRGALRSGVSAGPIDILTLVSGERTVRDILGESGWPAIDVYEALYALLEAREVRRCRAGGNSPSMNREEILEEIRKLEEARSTMVGDLIVRTRLARAYEQIGDLGRAAGIWKEIARGHRRKSDLKRTLDALKHAVRCVPEDFNVREQILDVYRLSGQRRKFVQEGRVVAEMFFKNGLLNRARHLLESLVAQATEDARLRKLHALTLLGLGERESALWELKELARILEKGGSQEELREVYRRILALDKGNRIVRRKLFDVCGSRKLVWVSRGLLAVAVLVLLAGGGFFLYERSARSSYVGEGIDLSALLDDNRFDDAREQVRKHREEYPYSSVGRRAEELYRQVEERERQYLATQLKHDILRAEMAEKAGDWNRALLIYRRIGKVDPEKHRLVAQARDRLAEVDDAEREAGRLVRQGRDFASVGDLESAHRIYNEVRELYPFTQAVASIRYPLELTTVPEDAKVFVNGEEMSGERPLKLFYSIKTRTRIRLEKEGFEPLAFEASKALKPRETCCLRKNFRWSYEAEGPLESSPVAAGGAVFVVGRDRYLRAISLEDGSLRFSVCLGMFGDTSASATVSDGVVVLASGRGEAMAVDPDDGRILWRRKVGKSVQADLRSSTAGRVVFVASTDGAVAALDARTGMELWSVESAAGPRSSPAASDSYVFVGSVEHRKMSALSIEDGIEAWSFPVRAAVSSSPGFETGKICFGSEDGRIYAVDVESRTEIASLKVSSRLSGAPLISGDTLYLSSEDGILHCYAIGSPGRLLWRRRLGGGKEAPLGPPVLDDGRLYVGGGDGSAYCLDAETGKILWAFATGGPVRGRPLVLDDIVLVASMDGKLYAIEK